MSTLKRLRSCPSPGNVSVLINRLWILSLGHKKPFSFHFVLLEHSFSECPLSETAHEARRSPALQEEWNGDFVWQSQLTATFKPSQPRANMWTKRPPCDLIFWPQIRPSSPPRWGPSSKEQGGAPPLWPFKFPTHRIPSITEWLCSNWLAAWVSSMAPNFYACVPSPWNPLLEAHMALFLKPIRALHYAHHYHHLTPQPCTPHCLAPSLVSLTL